MKKSLAKSKNALEEKRKMVKQKICITKDTHVYNNCYELRSRAINYTLHFHQIFLFAYISSRMEAFVNNKVLRLAYTFAENIGLHGF